MKTIVLIIMASALAFAGSKKIVIDLTTGDISTFQTRFLNGVPFAIEHFQSAGENVKTAVVVHGDAYKFFVDKLENTQYGVDENLNAKQEEFSKQLVLMGKKYDIEIEICRIGMNKRGILAEDLYPFAKTIPSSMIGLIQWQNDGYAYIPIH